MSDYTTLSPVSVDGPVESSVQGRLLGSFDTMPTPGAKYLGQTVLYTGATDTYVQNSVYTCVATTESDVTTYSWTKENITSIPIDSNPTQGSGNAVTSGGVYSQLDLKQDVLEVDISGTDTPVSTTVDPSPAANATHLVTSAGVNTALGLKQDQIKVDGSTNIATTADSAPAANADHLVTSGGVFTQLGLKFNIADMHTTTGDGTGAGITVADPIAMKSFVNSSISTNTANFMGTYNVAGDGTGYSLGLTVVVEGGVIVSPTNSQIASALGIKIADPTNPPAYPTNNDYCFVYFDLSQDPGNVDQYRRFKYTGTPASGTWDYEYTLNNSSFTQQQWAAINSGVSDQSAVGGYATVQGSQALTNKSVNGVTPTAQATGFTLAGGTTSKTLTVNNTYTLSDACALGKILSNGTISANDDANVPTAGAVYSAINICAKLNSENQFTEAVTLKSGPLYFKSNLDAPNISEFTWSDYIRFRDKNNVNVAGIQTAVDSAGQGVLTMQVYPNGGGDVSKEIRLLNDRAYCPTPPSNSNGTEIATCNWVNSVSHTFSGDNTFSGINTFSNTDGVYALNTKHRFFGRDETTKNNSIIGCTSPNGAIESRLYIVAGDDETIKMILSKWKNGVYVDERVIETF